MLYSHPIKKAPSLAGAGTSLLDEEQTDYETENN